MERYTFAAGTTCRIPAWTATEITDGVAALIGAFAHLLPEDRAARVVLKPNLNNDLVALTGNSTDLRVLDAVLCALRDRGYTHLVVADGSNIGIERRDIDVMKRLRVDRLCARYGAMTVDLNQDAGVRVVLRAGAHPRVARTVMDADFLISLPKIKTHAEAGLSCAMKNWVGIARGQEKRHMHYDLAGNIFAINEVVRPDLIIVDGVVGMEGNGPGDGDPFRFGQLIASDNALVNDLVVCRLVGMPWRDVGYLQKAYEAGAFDDALSGDVDAKVPLVRQIERPPPRGRMARLVERRELLWVKKTLRPITDRSIVTSMAYKARIIQDVYDTQDDAVTGLRKEPDRCGPCQKCADFCPTGLTADEIGVRTAAEDCIGCHYCWWVCPNDALQLDGPLNHLERQVARYREAVKSL